MFESPTQFVPVVSSRFIDHGRFLPGTMVASRYRIGRWSAKGAWARSIAPTT